MSAKIRQLFAILLTALLVSPAGSAAAAKPLGVVLETRNATLRATEITPGTTVFEGDTVSTGHGGRMLVRMGAVQIEIMPDSVASFEELGTIAGANVAQGTVGFASLENGTVAEKQGALISLVFNADLNIIKAPATKVKVLANNSRFSPGKNK